MKKTKVIIPAMGLLLLSTAASITGTVAWFAANASIQVTNMQVKAKAEGGVAIAAYSYTATAVSQSGQEYNNVCTAAAFTAPDGTAYADTATYGQASAAEIVPTSTAAASTWYHANSSSENDYAANGAYTILDSDSLKADGVFVSGNGQAAATAYKIDAQYFLYQKFSVKATASGSFSLWVSSISVSADTNSAALNKSLRIAVKHGSDNVAFFAPKYAANYDVTSLYYYNGSARTAYAAAGIATGTTPNTQIANASVSTTPSDLEIWVYYEGEDVNCKTINASDVDTLAISLTFTSVQPQ